MPLLACSTQTPGGCLDQTGEPVPPGPIHRIVPLAPDVTELAVALGAGPLLVAATPAADDPAWVKSLPQVQPDDAEGILAVRPDLVLATTAGNDPRTIGRLRELGLRVCTLDVISFDRLADACRLVGKVIGAPDRGEALASAVRRSVERLAARAGSLPHRRALYVVWWEPLIVAAQGTFHDDLLHRAGLANLAPGGAGRYPRVDPELLLDPRLETVVAPDESEIRAGYSRLLGTAAGTRLRRGAAQVIWLPAGPASRPGPRLPEALEALLVAREATERMESGVRTPEPVAPRIERSEPTSGGRPTR